jgi:acyl transferase domain-containing protein
LPSGRGGEAPRRAGVSSFGIGGTNVHVVLEEAPAPRPAVPGRRWQLLLLSGRGAAGLDGATRRLAEHLRRHPELSPEDVAFTLQAGRRRFAHRRAVLCRGLGEAGRLLEGEAAPQRVLTAVRHEEGRPVAFLLPGLGDHYAGMGAGLYRHEPVFREAMDECSRLLEPELGFDPRTVLFPAAAGQRDEEEQADAPDVAAAPGSGLDLRAMLGGGTNGADRDAGPLGRTEVAQPLLFAVEHSLARLFLAWGVRPSGLLGYSLGEYVAACLAGVLTLPDALALVARRARLIQELPPGRMLAVALPAERLRPWLRSGLWLTAINGPALAVAGGEPGAVAELAQRLAGAGVSCRSLRTSHAFHSGMMQPIVPRFRDLLRTVALREPAIGFVSNLTGTWVRRGEVTDPDYWVRHLCEPVQLAAGLAALMREPEPVLLEVGPGQSLGSLALQAQPAGTAPWTVAASLRHEHDRQPDELTLLRGVAQLWLAGADLDWHGFHGGHGARRRVPLPTHPFERRRYWIERATAPGGASAPAAGGIPGDGAEGRTADRAAWFYAPTWKRAVRPAPAPAAPPAPPDDEHWLLLAPGSGPGRELAMRLASGSPQVDLAIAGASCRRLDDGSFELDPDRDTEWDALFAALAAQPGRRRRIVDLLSLGAQATGTEGEEGFYRLLLAARALGSARNSQPVELCVVTTGLADVDRGDRLRPSSALLLGPLRVIPQEYPGIGCRAIDLGLAEVAEAAAAPERLADRLLAEIQSPHAAPLVALRGAWRWLPAIEPVRLEATAVAAATVAGAFHAGLRQGGVYLITGGLGGLGLALAEFLAREVKARLALVGRTPVPDRAARLRAVRAAAGEGTAPAGDGDGLRRKLHALEALEAAGAEVMTVAADVADPAGLRRAVAQVRRRFGRIDGVFHAAGVPGAGLVQLKSRAMAAQVLAPKVAGTLALEAALAGQQPDFLVLFSSLAAHLGGIGQVDYSAANAFLGAHAQLRAAGGDGSGAARRTLAVDWCEWQSDSWTGAVLDPEVSARLRQRRQAYGLSIEEGMDALCRALGSHLPQVIVSTRDLMPMLERQHSLQEVLDGLDQVRRDGAKHARPVLGTPYLAPRRDAERRLAAIWEELLGVGEVGVHDNFFQLGGHSLLGLQVAARVREVFAVELSLRALFEAPTVAELTAAIEAAAAASSSGAAATPATPEIVAGTIEPAAGAAEAEALLGRLDALSDEEIDALLAEPAEERFEQGRRAE